MKFKKFIKKSKYVIAICLILSLYLLSIPSSAYSTVINVPSSVDLQNGGNPYYTTCPVPIELNALFMTYDSGLTDYYQLAGNICPIVSFDESGRYIVSDDTIYDGVSTFSSFEYACFPGGGHLQIYDSYDLNLIGNYAFNINSVRFIPNADLYDISSLQDFHIVLRDFYTWNYPLEGFPSGSSYFSEIAIDFDYDEMPVQVRDVEFYYSIAGSSVLEHVVIPASVLDPDGDGYFYFEPSYFGIDDLNSLVYIYECTFSFDSVPTIPSSFLFAGDFYYTFNPYLDNLAPDDSEGENPALALIPYTTWLGEAVGGFMDFELYKGFTLGGIFVTLLSFTCVIWFLKLVAGG